MIKTTDIEYLGMIAVVLAIVAYTGLVIFLRDDIGFYRSAGLVLLGITALLIWIRGVGSDIRKRSRGSAT